MKMKKYSSYIIECDFFYGDEKLEISTVVTFLDINN